MFHLRILRWRNVYTYVITVALVMIAVTAYVSVRTGTLYRQSAEREMDAQALRIASMPELAEVWLADPDSLESTIRELSSISGFHLTAISDDGAILADSHNPAMVGENLTGQPEIRRALGGQEGQSRRSADESGLPLYLVTQPVRDTEGAGLGAIRVVFPVTTVESSVAQMQWMLAITGLLGALAIVGVLAYQARQRSTVLRQITEAVRRITSGDLSTRIESSYRGDLGHLANAFNQMAKKLQSQTQKRAREKDRLNTVMHVMTDGVIMLNKNGLVRLVNPAAARLLHTTLSEAMRRSFVRVARDHRIAEVWTRCRQSGEEEVAAIDLEPTRFLRVVVTPFLKGAARGYLVLLQDLSQVRHLQTVRQDFVSNISHELRTPLASLRALVETLRDGAVDDPPVAIHFLNRMEIEVDELTQIVEELLELSRIESGQVPLRLKPIPARGAIEPGAERLRTQAERKNVALTVAIPADTPSVLVDTGRVQQVVTNLVHNAIKFTEPGGSVSVSADFLGDTVTVAVVDTGLGIPESDLPRIFERFYKTDRARSMGGTGLGLAIAKHIVQAHTGEIWAESVEGEGSTFYFTLPVADQELSDSTDETQSGDLYSIVDFSSLGSDV